MDYRTNQCHQRQSQSPYLQDYGPIYPPNYYETPSRFPASSDSQFQQLQSTHRDNYHPVTTPNPLSNMHAPREHSNGTSSINPTYSPKTSLPIAIPQMSKGKGVPFQRLYAPALREYGSSEEEFITFIDTLNVVSAASPPFKVLDLAGGIVGMVPHHWAVAASNAMRLAAMGGTAIVSKSRTDTFLSESNRNLFGPRKLRVRLITTEALLVTINFPRERRMILPLDVNLPLTQQPSFHVRLLQGLQGYVSDTTPTNLPARIADVNFLDKLSADQVTRDIKKIDQKLIKESEKQMKHKDKKKNKDTHETASPIDGMDTDDIATKHARSRSLEKKMQKVEHDIDKINQSADKKLDAAKVSVAQIEAERAESLVSVLKKKEKLLEKEAKMQQKAEERGRHKEKDKKKSAEDKFAEKLLWVFIDSLPNEWDGDL